MINILLRTSNRPQEFKRCIHSIRTQTYKNVHVIICTDHDKSLGYIYQNITGLAHEVFNVTPTGLPFQWNTYCNDLKERVHDGWFFYLDDDDFLINRFCLGQIATQLSEHHGTICQFKRPRGLPKPRLKTGDVPPSEIIRGKIGGSCIFLHHTHKNLAHWDSNKAADYRFIRGVAQKIPLKFVEMVVVQAGNYGLHGH